MFNEETFSNVIDLCSIDSELSQYSGIILAKMLTWNTQLGMPHFCFQKALEIQSLKNEHLWIFCESIDLLVSFIWNKYIIDLGKISVEMTSGSLALSIPN